MDTSKFIVVLDRSDLNFINNLKKALGLEDGMALEITTPTFNRGDGRAITYFPKTVKEYESIKLLEPENLKKIGCQIWEEKDGKQLWLYPAEWYEHIPAGTKIVDINWETKTFVPGKTDDDRRSGALAYGFTKTK